MPSRNRVFFFFFFERNLAKRILGKFFEIKGDYGGGRTGSNKENLSALIGYFAWIWQGLFSVTKRIAICEAPNAISYLTNLAATSQLDLLLYEIIHLFI